MINAAEVLNARVFCLLVIYSTYRDKYLGGNFCLENNTWNMDTLLEVSFTGSVLTWIPWVRCLGPERVDGVFYAGFKTMEDD